MVVGASSLPATDRTVAAFVACLFDDGFTAATINAYVTSIQQRHSRDGLVPPDSFYLSGVLAGVARSAPPPGALRREPLDLDDLRKLAARPAHNDDEEALCWAVTLILWWSCRRVSLLCSTTTAGDATALRWRDIRVSGVLGARTVTFTQHRDKTHQNTIPFSSSFDELPAAAALVCPVRALARWVICWRKVCGVPPSPDDLIARWPSGSALTRAYFNDHLRQRCVRAGIDPACVSSHSLRRGAATTADDLGVHRDDIMDLGGWRSSAVDHYVAAQAGTQRALSTLTKAAVTGRRKREE